MADVYLAPGHGRWPEGRMDVGATGGGTNEQEAGDRIARQVENILTAAGLDVARQPKGGPNFIGTRNEIAEAGADVSLELHHDWRGAPRGGFGFHNGGERETICDALRAAYEQAGLPTRRDMTNLPGTSGPPSLYRGTPETTVLWEIDRIGTAGPEHAEAIAAGILNYLGVDVQEDPEPAPEPAPAPATSWTETLVTNLPTLRRRDNLGTATDDDRRVQGLLAAAGVLPIGPNTVNGRFDGKFGPSTEQAVRNFQSERNVAGGVDGIVGRHTWTALLGR